MPNIVAAQGSSLKFEHSQLSIKSKDTLHVFQIEIAANDSQRAYGMMFRNEIGENDGMLFIYDHKREINMWMKNTFISLDIVFIDDAGKIINIAHSAQPMSLSRIRSGGEAKAVLELKGGAAKRLEIEAGDDIIYPIFQNISK